MRLLREFVAGSRPPWVGPWHVQSARRRLGVLLGGDEGKALVSEADAFFRERGAVDPEHFVGTSLPGLEIRYRQPLG